MGVWVCGCGWVWVGVGVGGCGWVGVLCAGVGMDVGVSYPHTVLCIYTLPFCGQIRKVHP